MDLSPVNKAIAGAVVSLLVAYGARYGLNLQPVQVDALGVLVLAVVSAAVGFAGVYFSPKNK